MHTSLQICPQLVLVSIRLRNRLLTYAFASLHQDYVYAVTPLLEDALMDRDLVHRQTAAAAVKHLVRCPKQFGDSRAHVCLRTCLRACVRVRATACLRKSVDATD